MPSIAFYNSVVYEDNRPFTDDGYAQAYARFADIASRKGMKTYVVRGLRHYLGENSFDAGWVFEDGDWKPIAEEFSVDLIVDKGSDLPEGQPLRMINSEEMRARCMKQRTAELFPRHCPRTVRINDQWEWDKAIKTMSTDRIVLKPLDGYGGQGISIVGKEKALDVLPTFPFLLQEFIDTSKGIPGLCDGLHDLRLTFVGDSLIDCYLRQPASGKLLSNVMQGGSIRQIELQDIPQAARALAFVVDQAMSDIPDRMYSVDMGLHDGREWKIFELNAPPGMPTPDEDKHLESHLKFLADHLLRFAERPAE